MHRPNILSNSLKNYILKMPLPRKKGGNIQKKKKKIILRNEFFKYSQHLTKRTPPRSKQPAFEAQKTMKKKERKKIAFKNKCANIQHSVDTFPIVLNSKGTRQLSKYKSVFYIFLDKTSNQFLADKSKTVIKKIDSAAAFRATPSPPSSVLL